MFTGLIQAVGTVLRNERRGDHRRLGIDISGLSRVPEVGASICVSGACLTVVEYAAPMASFDAVEETLSRTTLSGIDRGDRVNLEPALRVGDPLDGHWVLGHVDAVGTILTLDVSGQSRRIRFSLPESIRPFVAEKGSIAIDGISLTVADVRPDSFSVAVIPHTLSETTLANRDVGDAVNLEADVLARYAVRTGAAELSLDFLKQNGFA